MINQYSKVTLAGIAFILALASDGIGKADSSVSGAVAAGLPSSSLFHTRSIAACDPADGSCGVAVVSFPTGVPAVVPVGEPGVAIANQAFPSYETARDIISRILSGDDAPTALADALAVDPLKEFHQFGVAALDTSSPSGVSVANFTGLITDPEKCMVAGSTYTVQANLQSSAAVCDAMAVAFENATGSLARRLLIGLKAGTPVGNDARGEFSAAVRVWSTGWVLGIITPLVADAGVNRSADWEAELTFSLNAYLASFAPPDPRDRVEVTMELGMAVLKVMRDLGFYHGRVDGTWSDDADAALIEFGTLNVFFPSASVVDGGIRYINGPLAYYIIEGAGRDVLTPAP